MRHAHVVFLAILVFSLLAAGCGGSPGRSPGVANVGTTGTTAGVVSGSGPSASSTGGRGQVLRSNAPQLSPTQQFKSRREALAFSACMRRHGVPDFPDPIFGADGNAGIHLAGNSSGDLNPNNPAFQTALQACRGYKLGDKKAPGTFNAGGPK